MPPPLTFCNTFFAYHALITWIYESINIVREHSCPIFVFKKLKFRNKHLWSFCLPIILQKVLIKTASFVIKHEYFWKIFGLFDKELSLILQSSKRQINKYFIDKIIKNTAVWVVEVCIWFLQFYRFNWSCIIWSLFSDL